MDGRRVAVFWDYDTCPITANIPAYQVVDNINTVATRYGSATTFNLYLFDRSQANNAVLTVLSEIASNGVALVFSVPNVDRDPAVRFRTDVLLFGVDYDAASTVIILITRNAQHTYPLQMLQQRGFTVVLITSPSDDQLQTLCRRANPVLDWNGGIPQ